MAGTRGRPRTLPAARCPDPTHKGGHVKVDKTRKSKHGVRRVYECSPLVGDRHFFTVVVTEASPTPLSTRQPPPGCPEHPEGHVVRDGTYGKRSPLPRQRYRCYPDPSDKATFHSFVPPLARQHVHETGEQCAACEETRGIHHGEPAVARQHSWPAKTVARALEMLSGGGSYAEVSRWALRSEAADLETVTRARKAASPDGTIPERRTSTKKASESTKKASESTTADTTIKRRPRRTNVKEPRVIVVSGGKTRRQSRASVEAKNVWHIAADWCEAFGPVIWEPIEDQLRQRALAERARLDALRTAGQPLVRPQVLLIDDMPVYGRDDEGIGRTRRDKGYFLLSVAEVTWGAADPWDTLALPVPTTELRLVRAFPKSNGPAWRLVFDELGYEPDFVVADAGTGQYAAVQTHYPNAVFVPSMWHVARAIRTSLKDVKAAHQFTVTGKTLDPELETHLRQLRRGTDALANTDGVTAWWDELLAWAKRRKVPVEKLRSRRKDYEKRMLAAIPKLNEHPEVPISTGGLETIQRRVIEPVMAGRRATFGNVERTNTLLDLAVARAHGAFDDLAEVARQLRIDATDAEGWAPPLRAVADPGGTRSRYSSLRDATLLSHLARERGLL